MGIAIIDYGMGNLGSVQKALEKVGGDVAIESDPEQLSRADKIVLPGVGAIADAMRELKSRDLIEPIKKMVRSGRPFLGICLGFQLLFDKSAENGGQEGLGLFSGEVSRFELPHEFPVPHIGWNQLHFKKASAIYEGLKDNTYVYFVHSYYVVPKDKELTATETDYGIDFCSSIAYENVFATQFHPEKSQGVGLKILENFVRL